MGAPKAGGSVSVYAQGGGSFTFNQTLTSSRGAAATLFGNTVAVNGTTAMVAESVGSFGVVSAFAESNNTWTQTQELMVNGAPGDLFGASVAYGVVTSVGTPLVIVGAPSHQVGNNPAAGAVYVFGENLQYATWRVLRGRAHGQRRRGVPDQFGASVAASGNVVIVGAPGHSAGAGAAYVFTPNAQYTTWTQQSTASNGAANDRLGASVAMNGTTAIVGAPGHAGAGAAYVFTPSGTTWTQQQLTASDGAANDQLGASVAASGTTAIVGAPDTPGRARCTCSRRAAPPGRGSSRPATARQTTSSARRSA